MLRVVTLAAAVLAPPSVARAEPASIVVRYEDLSLDSARDARRLVRRIDLAALRACGAGPKSLQAVARAVRRSSCWAQASGEAVDALAAPQVTAAYEARLGKLRRTLLGGPPAPAPQGARMRRTAGAGP